MPHVTFVHGISNKPPADDLLRIWREALADAASPLPLGDYGVTSNMVYWADLLYETPAQDLTAYEGVLESTLEAVDAAGDVPLLTPSTAEEARFIAGLRASLTTLTDPEVESESLKTSGLSKAAEHSLERVPLPWFIKKRFMNAYLRDVHHYLFDVDYGPAGRAPLRIQHAIRGRFVSALCGAEVSRPHVVVSHSMGTVIAYDCLKRVAGCTGVDGLITLGSPLGLDEIQDRLRPEWTRSDGYPSERLTGEWVNIFDRLDPVCGFDPQLANDYRSRGLSTVEDVPVQNSGIWRHSGTKYLRQTAFASSLNRMLRL